MSAGSSPADPVIASNASRRRRLLHPSALLLLGYSLLSFAYFHAAWAHPTTRYIGEGGDPQMVMWFLSWTPHALTHGLNPWVSDYMNYPHGLNVMWNTGMPLAGLVLWPVTALFGTTASYNVLMTAAPALAAWTAHLAIQRFVPSRGAAAMGGLVYGFSPYVIAHSFGHANLVTIFIPPLLLLVVDEILVRQRRRWWVAGSILAALVTAQLFLGEEVLALTAVSLAIGTAVLAVLHRSEVRPRVPHALRAIALGAAITVVIAAWPLAVQLWGPERPHGPLQGRDIFVNDSLNFVVPTVAQRFAPDRAITLTQRFSGFASEWNAYLGIPLVLLLLYVLARYWRDPLVRVFGLTGMVLAILSLGPHLHIAGRITHLPLPGYMVDRIPLLGNEIPNRLMMCGYLIAGLLVALFIHRTWPGDLRRHAVVALIVAVALLPLIPATARTTDTMPAPAYFTSAHASCLPAAGSVLVVPYPTGVTTAPMLWQVASGWRFRMIGGYFGVGPTPEHNEVPVLKARLTQLELHGTTDALNPLMRWVIAHEMRSADIRAVVSGPSPNQPAEVVFLTALLGRSPVADGGAYVWCPL